MGGFCNQNRLVGKNIDGLNRELISVREESTTNKNNVQQASHRIFGQLKSMGGQNNVGGSKRQDIENKIGGFVASWQIGPAATKRRKNKLWTRAKQKWKGRRCKKFEGDKSRRGRKSTPELGGNAGTTVECE